MILIYGIKNCDTIKKTIQFFKNNNIEFEFHDYKTQSISKTKLNDWIKDVSLEQLINKKGTTYKKLSDSDKQALNNPTACIEIIINNTSVLKRPIIEINNKIIRIGFNEVEYNSYFKQ